LPAKIRAMQLQAGQPARKGNKRWIALSMAAISRTLVEGTWLQILRYQRTTQRCMREELGRALGETHTGVGYDQPNAVEAAFLEMCEECGLGDSRHL
jgi:hypothetical protein